MSRSSQRSAWSLVLTHDIFITRFMTCAAHSVFPRPAYSGIGLYSIKENLAIQKFLPIGGQLWLASCFESQNIPILDPLHSSADNPSGAFSFVMRQWPACCSFSKTPSFLPQTPSELQNQCTPLARSACGSYSEIHSSDTCQMRRTTRVFDCPA